MKQIIVLDTQPLAGGEATQLNVVFWFPVTPGREVMLPGVTSIFRSINAAEILALQNGSVVEEPFSGQIPSGWNVAQIKAQLITIYNNRLAAFNTKPNPNAYYGTSWDGNVWT